LSNVNCTGNESYLGKCGNIRWGNVDRCMSDTDPAVYCYNKQGMKALILETTKSIGFVKLKIRQINWFCTYNDL